MKKVPHCFHEAAELGHYLRVENNPYLQKGKIGHYFKEEKIAFVLKERTCILSSEINTIWSPR